VLRESIKSKNDFPVSIKFSAFSKFDVRYRNWLECNKIFSLMVHLVLLWIVIDFFVFAGEATKNFEDGRFTVD
jgi:hypothetical protein